MTTHIIHGFMHGRATHMPRTWPDNTLRSVNNAFTGAYFVPGVPGTYTAPSKPGVKPTLVLNTAGKPQATLAPRTTGAIAIENREQGAASTQKRAAIRRAIS